MRSDFKLGWGPVVGWQEEGKVSTVGRAESTTKCIAQTAIPLKIFMHAAEESRAIVV